MRRLFWFASVLLVLAACGGGLVGPGVSEVADPAVVSTSAVVSTTQPAPTSSSTVTPSSSTAPISTTSRPSNDPWSVAALGRNPSIAISATAALGSGCAPGSDQLPDGVWFGWIVDTGSASISFDLACLWPGRLEPAVGNDSNRVRAVPVLSDASVHIGDSDPVHYSVWFDQGVSSLPLVDNAPGLPRTSAHWIFVNDGAVTELAEYSEPLLWAMFASAWPGLAPGCCDGGTVAPVSPSDPWPNEGWPADGFYPVFAEVRTDTEYMLAISRWLDCDDHADLCPEWWQGDEVTGDPDEPSLTRRLVLDEDLTVVILPILTDSAIVGDGAAFRSLVSDVGSAGDLWIPEELDYSFWEAFPGHFGDPAFPFGYAEDPDVYAVFGYRGPGGAHLTFEEVWGRWWLVLEIRSGRPILYVHAGQIAG